MNQAKLGAAMLVVLMSACSPARAVVADPANDVHCFTLAVGVTEMMRQHGGTAEHRAAANIVHQWYGQKFDAAVQKRGREQILAEAEPVSRLFETDQRAAREALFACIDRAGADPEFEEFGKRLAR